MKILLAADIFPPESGGPATYVVTLANELSKRGHKITIVSLNPSSDSSIVSCSVLHVAWKNKLLRYLQYFWLLIKHAKRADVIYAMGPVNAGYPASLAAKWRGKKFVVKVVGDYAWEQGVCRFGVSEDIDIFQKYEPKSSAVKILRRIERKVVSQAAAVIVPSSTLKEIVQSWGASEDKIEVIYNAVEYVYAEPVVHEGEKWVVSAGRLMPWKGMDALVDVVAELAKENPEAKWRLKIIGDGPEMSYLRKKIAADCLDGVVDLLGNLPKDKTLSYMSSADIFVLNSGYEGFSHVLVEAHNQGVPVIASNVGANREIVSEEGLFEYNNKAEIKEKILSFIKLGKRKSIPHGFWKDMIDETEKVLQKICAS